jgi:hypothetical protein
MLINVKRLNGIDVPVLEGIASSQGLRLDSAKSLGVMVNSLWCPLRLPEFERRNTGEMFTRWELSE